MCGIFAVLNCPEASKKVYLGLHANQHRATEFAGIATSDGHNMFRQSGPGIVQEVFKTEDLERLRGLNAVGHIRYPTVNDEPGADNTQPIMGVFQYQGLAKEVAVAHNGNLVNYGPLRERIKALGIPMKTRIDTEIIVRLFCLSQSTTIEGRVFDAIKDLRGAYSLVFLFGETLIAVKDPYGFRPLVLGKRDGSWFVSSESVAFDNMHIDTVRQVEPGEIVIIDKDGPRSFYFDENRLETKPVPHKRQQCIFELIYFTHPGSNIFGQPVVRFRQNAGRRLCQECPVHQGSKVIGIPDSATFHAQGFASASPDLEFVFAILRSHYVGRSFLLPTNALRVEKILRKFGLVKELITGQRIVIVDDSIVRMNTLKGLISLIKWAKPLSVDVRIVAPPIRGICCYGIDTPSLTELVAANLTLDEMKTELGVDSLEFLSLEGLRSLVPDPENYCFACMDGNYSIPPQLPPGERYFAGSK